MQAINRRQMVLRPMAVEQLIPEDHPARAIWELVGQRDLGRFYAEIKAVEGTAGRRVALIEAVSRGGAFTVRVVPEPLAAAVGAWLDVTSPYAQLIVDIGDGVTEVAVIQSGDILTSVLVPTACSSFHAAVSDLVPSRYKVRLFSGEAERLTKEVVRLAGHSLRHFR